MKARKFVIIITAVLSTFLFLTGIATIILLNNMRNNPQQSEINGSILNKVIKGLSSQSKEPFNVLILGGDKVNKNTDSILLVNVNPGKSTVDFLSIPRDTKTKIDGKTRKINFAYPHKGGEFAAETVGSLLEVDVKYYVMFDIKAFREIIDLLGGVDFYVPADLNYDDPTQNLYIHLEKGQQRLSGSEAEQFMRFRQPSGKFTKELKEFYDGSDLKRIEGQQNFIKEVIRQKLNFVYLSKLPEIINIVYKNLDTNITMNEVLKLIKSVPDLKTENVRMHVLPGTSGISDGLWFFMHDKAGTEEIIDKYFNNTAGTDFAGEQYEITLSASE